MVSTTAAPPSDAMNALRSISMAPPERKGRSATRLTCPTSPYLALPARWARRAASLRRLRGHRERGLEHLHRLLHIRHRADGDTAVRLFVRRKVTTDENALLGAEITEAAR